MGSLSNVAVRASIECAADGSVSLNVVSRPVLIVCIQRASPRGNADVSMETEDSLLVYGRLRVVGRYRLES